MKKLAIFLLAAGSALVPAAASAQVLINTPGRQVIAHPGGGDFHFPRFNRHGFFNGGFVVGGFFFQPQFHVQNWQLYGFAHPGQHRWIRYYDDALLIDRRGRVHDFRERVAWDRYGERWDHDRYGIPHYVGRGDYYPDDRDYDYVEDERYERHGGYRDERYGGYRDERYGWDYRDYGRGGHAGGYGHAPAPLTGCGPQPCVGYGAPGYNMQGYGGAGYGTGYYMAPVVITETTVTPATTVVTEEIVEEVVYEERAARRARPHRPRAARPCNCPPPRRAAPAPRHPPGERG